MVDKKLEYTCTENWRLSNTNPTKNQKWTCVLHRNLQFLLLWYHIIGVGAGKLPPYFILFWKLDSKNLLFYVPCPLKLGLSKKWVFSNIFRSYLHIFRYASTTCVSQELLWMYPGINYKMKKKENFFFTCLVFGFIFVPRFDEI